MVEVATSFSVQSIFPETSASAVSASIELPTQIVELPKMPVYEEVFARVSQTPQFNAASRDVMAQDRLVLIEFRRQLQEHTDFQRKKHLEELKTK